MATFDPNRVGPGTFELTKDPSTGEYKLNQVGFLKGIIIFSSLTLVSWGKSINRSSKLY